MGRRIVNPNVRLLPDKGGVEVNEMVRRRRRVAELQKLIKPLTEIKKEKINDGDQPDGT